MTDSPDTDETVGAALRALLATGAHAVYVRPVPPQHASLGNWSVDVTRFDEDCKQVQHGDAYGATLTEALVGAHAAYLADEVKP